METTNVYVLRLAGGKYYVGKSSDPERRFAEHVAGTGSAWTRIHKPEAIESVTTNASPFEEDKKVRELMALHGIDNVRGGCDVELHLSTDRKAALQREIWAATDRCTRCGRDSHFVSDCYAARDVNKNLIEVREVPVVTPVAALIVCARCGHGSHNSEQCYAKWHANGSPLVSQATEKECVLS